MKKKTLSRKPDLPYTPVFGWINQATDILLCKQTRNENSLILACESHSQMLSLDVIYILYTLMSA